jgi:FkbM family methyltransferase
MALRQSRLARSAPVQTVVQTARILPVVKERVRFATAQVLGGRRVGQYELTESGLTLYLRHNTRDVDVLREIFVWGEYEMPEEVVARVSPRPIVLDVGANIGLFGLFIYGRYPDARVISVEPDRGNAALLERCISANRLGDRWTTVVACASTGPGVIRFRSGLFCDSHIDPDGDPVPAVDLFDLADEIDLLKMDIEGGEWPIIDDPRWREVDAKAILLEWHSDASPHPDARAWLFSSLITAGFTVQPCLGEAANCGRLWAWRSEDPAILSSVAAQRRPAPPLVPAPG